jgi:hypothetical protein
MTVRDQHCLDEVVLWQSPAQAGVDQHRLGCSKKDRQDPGGSVEHAFGELGRPPLVNPPLHETQAGAGRLLNRLFHLRFERANFVERHDDDPPVLKPVPCRRRG